MEALLTRANMINGIAINPAQALMWSAF